MRSVVKMRKEGGIHGAVCAKGWVISLLLLRRSKLAEHNIYNTVWCERKM